jgi:hypothetical protein
MFEERPKSNCGSFGSAERRFAQDDRFVFYLICFGGANNPKSNRRSFDSLPLRFAQCAVAQDDSISFLFDLIWRGERPEGQLQILRLRLSR